MTTTAEPEPGDAHDPAADAAPEPGAHDRARLALPKRLLLLGPPAAFVLSFLTSLLGADGRAGAFTFLLLLALVLGGTGLLVAVQLLLDERRGRPTSVRRSLLAGGLFVATFVCMTAVGGFTTGGGS